MMYLLTKTQGNLESGAYASVDEDGVPIVQFFVNKDGYTKRPFYHMVTPGAWLEAIPDPFQIDHLRDGIKYVGFVVGKPGWTYDKY